MKQKDMNHVGRTRSDIAFDRVNTALCLLLLVIFLYPIWYILIASVSSPGDIWAGNVIFLPKGFHLSGYKSVFRSNELMRGYLNSILYTFLGTAFSLLLTISAAFPLAQRDFKLRGFFMKVFAFTMYFGGGLVPTYLLIRDLGLLNSFWVVPLTSALSVSNMIIMRTFFSSSIPYELKEASQLDGANHFQYLFMVVLPLSTAIIAVMCLYYGVAHWNAYFNAMIYLMDRKLFPLQLFLREILNTANASLESFADSSESMAEIMQRQESLKYCVIVVSAVPALIAYPFVQKYFVKGIMIGALKG